MNEKSIKNISTKGLHISQLIEIVDEFNHGNFIGKKFLIGNYLLVRKPKNTKCVCIDVLTDKEYKMYDQWKIDKYDSGESIVSIRKPINIDEEFISYYDVIKLIREQRIADGGEKFKKVKVKKIERKKN